MHLAVFITSKQALAGGGTVLPKPPLRGPMRCRWAVCLYWLTAVAFAYGNEPQADYTVELPVGKDSAQSELMVAKAGSGSVLVRGLQRGGAVLIKVNDETPRSVELLASGGMGQGKADCALVLANLAAGVNKIWVEEKAGAQIVRVPNTAQWFGASSDIALGLRFSVDFDQLRKVECEFPVTVYYGPRNEEFFYFSGKFDYYFGESFTSEIGDVSGNSGEQEATLRYTARHPQRGLLMPMQITLVRGDLTGNFSLRVRQVLRAEETPQWPDNVEFLHVMLSKTYGQDWNDGVPDWAWYRTQKNGNPDALAGGYTALARMRDYSSRTYTFPSSTSDPTERSLSGIHHTGSAASMEAVNAIGGWFAKSGVGSCGLVFHQYHANFRDDLRPLHSHCGDGADTHHYLVWGNLFHPVGMKKGDEVEIEYSLCFLPSEPLFTDILDFNEADRQLFGDEQKQKSPVIGWVGTKEALGMKRKDGSLLLYGLGEKSGKIRIQKSTKGPLGTVYHLADPARPRWVTAPVETDEMEVSPGLFTIVDCGALLMKPSGSK